MISLLTLHSCWAYLPSFPIVFLASYFFHVPILQHLKILVSCRFKSSNPTHDCFSHCLELPPCLFFFIVPMKRSYYTYAFPLIFHATCLTQLICDSVATTSTELVTLEYICFLHIDPVKQDLVISVFQSKSPL